MNIIGFPSESFKRWIKFFDLDDDYPVVVGFSGLTINETPCGTWYKGVWYPPIKVR